MPKRDARNARGAGMIRLRTDGRWEARYTTGRNPGTGRQVQKSIYASTQKEARQKLTAAIKALDEGTYTEPSKLTVGAWMDMWLSDYTANIKEHTRATYETQVRVHIKPALGAAKLTALTAPEVQTFHNTLAKGKGDKRPLSPKTIKNINGVLHKALDQAVRLGYIRVNPCSGVVLPRLEKPDMQPLSGETLDAFISAIKGHPLETAFIVDIFTGMRQSELMGLMWDCVDFESGTILIDKQLIKEKKSGGIYKFASPKNDKSRRIAPPPSILNLLRTHREKQQEWKQAAGVAWRDTQLVFTNELGENLSHSTLSHMCKRIMRQIGQPSGRFHDLRHTYAVNAIRAGVDIKSIQDSMGHYSAAFTLDVYAHVTDQIRQETANKMESFYQSVQA